MPRLRCVIKKKINKSVINNQNEVTAIKHLNYKAPEKSHGTEELAGYTIQ